MEKVLQNINAKCIALSKHEVQQNNQILYIVVSTLIEKMQAQDALFKSIFRHVFYGGSFYDGLKVGKPEEFDLDFLLFLPQSTEPVLSESTKPGFGHVQVKKTDPKYVNLDKLLDEKRFLMTEKVLSWIESIIQKSLDEFPLANGKYGIRNCQVKCKKSGPALTLNVQRGKRRLDVDVVVCFAFSGKDWPKEGYRQNPNRAQSWRQNPNRANAVRVQSWRQNSNRGRVKFWNPNSDRMKMSQFFIVPKRPKNLDNPHVARFWRFSFQKQERAIIANKGFLKPALRLLKKLRDTVEIPISSYCIKTVFLHLTLKKEPEFWHSSLNVVFMESLKEFRDCLRLGPLSFFWNSGSDLFCEFSEADLQDFAGRLTLIIDDVERNASEPRTIERYFGI